ncbi:MAG: CAAX prenyl protease-related protein [Pirellula sp.]
MSDDSRVPGSVPEVARWTIPFGLYVVGTTVAAQLDRSLYPLAYSALTILLLIGMWQPLRCLELLKPHKNIFLPIALGVFGIVAWIVLTNLNLDRQLASYLPKSLRPSERQAFDPFSEIDVAWQRYGFIAARILGLVVVVPIAEELFWRGFLMRWFINEDWQKVRFGTYSHLSFWGVVALFMLAHPEWIAAAAYCVILNSYSCWRRDLWGCTVAHATSNLLLAVYVLATCQWVFW